MGTMGETHACSGSEPPEATALSGGGSSTLYWKSKHENRAIRTGTRANVLNAFPAKSVKHRVEGGLAFVAALKRE